MSFGDGFDMEAQQVNMDSGRSWRSVGTEAWENLGPSAKKAASDFADIFIHPVDTVEGMYHVFAGAVQKLVPGRQDDEKYAEAVWNHFVERYGGAEKFKDALGKDPAGVAVEILSVPVGVGLGKVAVSTAAKTAKMVAKKVNLDKVFNNAAVRAAESLSLAVEKFRECVKRPVETIILDPANEMQMKVAREMGVIFEKDGVTMVRSHEGATELKNGCRIAIDKTENGPVYGYNIKEEALQKRYTKEDSPLDFIYVSKPVPSFSISVDMLEKTTGEVKDIINYMKHNEIPVNKSDGTKVMVKQLSKNADGSWHMVAPWGEEFDIVKGSQILIDNPKEVAKALKDGVKPPVPDVRPVKPDVFESTYAYKGSMNADKMKPLNSKDMDICAKYADIIAKDPNSLEYIRFRAYNNLVQNRVLSGEQATEAVKQIFNIKEEEIAQGANLAFQ